MVGIWTRRKGTTDEGEEDSKEEVAWEVDRWFSCQRQRTLKSDEEEEEEEVEPWCVRYIGNENKRKEKKKKKRKEKKLTIHKKNRV